MFLAFFFGGWIVYKNAGRVQRFFLFRGTYGFLNTPTRPENAGKSDILYI